MARPFFSAHNGHADGDGAGTYEDDFTTSFDDGGKSVYECLYPFRIQSPISDLISANQCESVSTTLGELPVNLPANGLDLVDAQVLGFKQFAHEALGGACEEAVDDRAQ